MANQVNLGKIIGATGATGATGPAGEKGADGLTPYIATNGNWFLGAVDTGITAKGNEWLYGDTVPTTQGNNGDLYLINSGDNLGNVYKKQNGIWNFIINITGPQGEKGEKGDTALSVSVGTVTTGETGTNASVTNSGTNTDLVLDFIIPKGDKGEKGDKGDDGNTTVYIDGFAQPSINFYSDPQNQIDNKLQSNFGSENTGKYLKVNEDGFIIPATVSGGTGGGAVSSVNGQIGDVVLSAEDIGAVSEVASVSVVGGGERRSIIENGINQMTFSVEDEDANGVVTTQQVSLSPDGMSFNNFKRPTINGTEKMAYLSDIGDVDTSNFVDLTSAQKITGAKTFKQILLAQTEWTEPVTTFSKSTNYVLPDRAHLKLDPSNPDNKDTMPVRFVCGNNGLFCIIAENGELIADYTGQTPLGTSAIYRIAYGGGGDRIYVTGRNGVFWINIDTFDFNNPVWSELKTGITGYVYAVAHYYGEVNGSYNNYMLFGTGRNVIMYNEDTDTWGSSISLGVTSGYAEFFLPYWKDDEQVYFFFARNVFGYFNPRTGAIVKNTDYTISGTAYTYYLDGNLVYLQDSNKTIGVYDLDTMTRVKSSELGNVSWSGYIYTIQQNYDGNLIIGGANSNIVIIDKDTFEAKEVFELKYGSLTNFAFYNWNGDWYYVTDTAISSPSNVQKDILNFIPAGTRVAEFTLFNENWIEEADEKTGDKIYYYDLSLGSLGKTDANHATVGLAHSLIGLEAYENTQKIINANIFSTYDFGSDIRLYAKDIDTIDVGNSMIITVEVYE